MKCVEVMKSRKIDHYWSSRRKACEVKSLVNVLQRGEVKTINNGGDYYVGDLSAIFQILQSEGFDKKRDRDNYDDKIRPAKRMTIVMSN